MSLIEVNSSSATELVRLTAHCQPEVFLLVLVSHFSNMQHEVGYSREKQMP